MRHSTRYLLVLFLVLVSSCIFLCNDTEETCEATGNCPLPPEVQGTCISPSASLYNQGAIAQAYKPNAPLSSEVCSLKDSKNYKYKVASWHLSRKSFPKGFSPQLDITLNFHSCSQDDDNNNDNDGCHCQDLSGPVSVTNTVEVWQARPDGQYSSLRNSDDCRAQVQVNEMGKVHFSTLAPGSSGFMGGLGPAGFDMQPYGPPVIHTLIQMNGHAPVLIDLPVLLDPKTLAQKTFSLGDWRGQGWMKSKPKESVAKLVSWEPITEENRISIEYDISLQQTEDPSPVKFCEAFFNGLPSSFFVEPIAVCSPSTLDFLAL